jgi:tetratricopeptide (TPR) repeat protein
MLGYALIETGNYPEAQTAFKKSLAISNNFGENMRAFWIEKYNAGANDFQTGIDLENNKNATGAKTSFESALRNFEASSSIMPDSVRSISAIGETYLALGQDEKALQIFSDLSSKSRSPEYSIKIAKVLFESGLGMMQSNNFLPASEVFKKIILLPNLPDDNPYHETSAYNLGLALSKSGEIKRNADENSDYKALFSEALVYLEPLTVNLKKKDLEPQIYELLVSVYANLGMTDKAEDALNKKNAIK